MKNRKSILISLLAVLLAFSGFLPSMADAKSLNEPVSKGDFVQELVTNLGIDLQDGEVPFTDVNDELKPYFEAAIRTNIVSEDEVSESPFGVNEKVTREQAYVFLIRALNLRDSYSQELLESYRDFNAIDSSYYAELAAAEALGLIDATNVLQPKKPLNQKEMKNIFDSLENELDFVSVIHTNDMHGRIMHNSENGELGLAKISELTNQARNENPTLLVDLGDTFHGTNYVDFNKGLAAVEAMNAMSYDAMVPGNHDFNYGQDYLLELKDKLDFPLVSANILKDRNPYLDGYTMIEKDGKRIALVGLTATDTAEKTNPAGIEGITFEDEVTAAKEAVAELEGQVDTILAISHSGLETDRSIANEVEGIDVIFGGHSHDTLETPVKYEHGYVTQAFEYGKALGHTNLIFHEDQLVGVNGFLYRDGAEKTEDPEISSILQSYKVEVDREMDEVIASTNVRLDGERANVRTKETNLGNLLTDAMRNELETDIAVTNGGGIRASIPAGEVTRNHVFTTLPFDNTLVRTMLTGEEILAALEHSVRVYPEENGGFLHVSGLTFTFNPAQPAGSRVEEVFVNGEELNVSESYSVATNNFTAAGGDGFNMFSIENIEFDSGELLSTILIDSLQSRQDIPDVEGRIQVK
ncbi:Protein ushA precursor (two S-layer domains, UDP-sugar hydrolase, 5'-nucleotidase) [Alkalihalophilus pseudofirmus OF4]|uniref:Protein ushA (Two S-layer domains, UDP-sugar hydrolase, 5'-nucleotidase) n=1 Tax=Alkalihalophilus pseudofirmus (strain ATCC BAA-2126 / JCM 17055 / OF4) TaxID=398511 RepID=D3FQK4_ALKPO|nr:bifunctional UDP-sugar hydrolase/5'-nucleotidase [Alkalihalophilus pseudofirmus]ADC51374.1 Protein ushA precursor (two S-layer domains, UDP-sugar hydrolase, 5'-nucleotidase) [Alkalihalophilus pseudofirmus OF4]